MYTKGELEVVTAADLEENFGPPDPDEGPYLVPDDRDTPQLPPAVRLPHSCEYWVIGGVAEIDALLDDLLAARLRLLDEREKK